MLQSNTLVVQSCFSEWVDKMLMKKKSHKRKDFLKLQRAQTTLSTKWRKWDSLHKIWLQFLEITPLVLLNKKEQVSREDGLRTHMSLITPTIKKFSLERNQNSLKQQQRTCFMKTQKWDNLLKLMLKIKIFSLLTMQKHMWKWVNMDRKKLYWVNSKIINQSIEYQKQPVFNLVHFKIQKSIEVKNTKSFVFLWSQYFLCIL